jgi:hypothetical protein
MKTTAALGIFVVGFVLMVLTGCGRGQQVQTDNDPVVPDVYSAQGLHGSSAAGVSCSVKDNILTVSFTQIPATGQYVRVGLPSGQYPSAANWKGNSQEGAAPNALTIAVQSEYGWDLGVMPLETYPGGTISVSTTLSTTAHSESSAKEYPDKMLSNLAVIPGEEGQVALSWVQEIPGDYNFDSTVDVLDLQALAARFGESVDRSDPDAQATPEYWLDGAGDGIINEQDIAIISGHYGCTIGGFNVYRKGSVIAGLGGSSPSIRPCQVAARLNLPPQYNMTIDGTTQDAIDIVPVFASGLEGTPTLFSSYTADLIVNTNVSGIGLESLIDAWSSGTTVTKQGTRVIDDIEIIGRPTLAKPTVVSGKTSVYSGLTKNKTLYLDIRYLPVVNLTTGALRATSELRKTASTTIDNAEGLQCTAIPFTLYADTGTLQINASISIAANPMGGYFIDLVADQIVPHKSSERSRLRLAYKDGVLMADHTGDGQYSDDFYFSDNNRDQVSNILAGQNKEGYPDPSYTPMPVDFQAILGTLQRDANYATFSEIQLKPDQPQELKLCELFRVNELTYVAYPEGEESWQEGDLVRVSGDYWTSSNPDDPCYFETGQIELVSRRGSDPLVCSFTASTGRSDGIELNWNKVENCTGYVIQRSYFVDPFQGYQFETSWEFNSETASFFDEAVLPLREYRYELYGLIDGESSYRYFSDACGSIIPPSTDPVMCTLTGSIRDEPFDDSLAFTISDGKANITAIRWNAETTWYYSGFVVCNTDFHQYDMVIVQAFYDNGEYHAVHVEKWPNLPPDEQPVNPPPDGVNPIIR